MSNVAVKDGDIIGFISIIFYKTLFHSGGTALINELIVSEDYRRKGVGKKLISKAIKIAKQRGMDEIEVGTEKKNIIAQSFYKKCGFNNEYILLSKTF
ncbi:MAG: GNAT family N-acetyltransferase [Actinomycetota bacterium]|nr:GNAT family N-acetyltransferase [Actinomycetota bacterium]